MICTCSTKRDDAGYIHDINCAIRVGGALAAQYKGLNVSPSNTLPGSSSLHASPGGDQTQALARRDSCGVRYDLLYEQFLHAMAMIGNYGAQHYGEGNWMKSRLIGEHGPINHIYEHLGNYRTGANYDHPEIGTAKRFHLAAIAFNAMMEFYYEDNEIK